MVALLAQRLEFGPVIPRRNWCVRTHLPGSKRQTNYMGMLGPGLTVRFLYGKAK